MSDHYKFFSHKQCEYYPCHQLDEINCLFCYCPLYILKDCKGHYKMIGNIDSQFCNKLHVLLLQMQEQGLFSHHIDIEAMVGAIYSILSNNVLFYIIEEDMTKESMATKLERQIQVILPTIKNEIKR